MLCHVMLCYEHYDCVSTRAILMKIGTWSRIGFPVMWIFVKIFAFNIDNCMLDQLFRVKHQILTYFS